MLTSSTPSPSDFMLGLTISASPPSHSSPCCMPTFSNSSHLLLTPFHSACQRHSTHLISFSPLSTIILHDEPPSPLSWLHASIIRSTSPPSHPSSCCILWPRASFFCFYTLPPLEASWRVLQDASVDLFLSRASEAFDGVSEERFDPVTVTRYCAGQYQASSKSLSSQPNPSRWPKCSQLI